MRAFAAPVYGLALLGALGSAVAASECPGNPGALGTSRVMTIDPAEYPRIGTIQYRDSLPLEPKEVVLTFDDGPMPPYTIRILEVLASECVKANYFIVGRMARGYPDLLRRIHAEGHVIGAHSETHPLAFDKMSPAAVRNEIETGFASTAAALRVPNGVAPFFRIPGLLRADNVESYLRSRRTTVWSADVTGDDWRHITAADVVKRVMSRLSEKGKGIILLHDIQPATALALPELLRQLKKGGYRIVQVAPINREPAVAVVTPPPIVTASKPATQPAPPPAVSAAPTPPPVVNAPRPPVEVTRAPARFISPEVREAQAAAAVAPSAPPEPVRPPVVTKHEPTDADVAANPVLVERALPPPPAPAQPVLTVPPSPLPAPVVTALPEAAASAQASAAEVLPVPSASDVARDRGATERSQRRAAAACISPRGRRAGEAAAAGNRPAADVNAQALAQQRHLQEDVAASLAARPSRGMQQCGRLAHRIHANGRAP